MTEETKRLTVGELKKALERFPDDILVVFDFTGDDNGYVQAEEVEGPLLLVETHADCWHAPLDYYQGEKYSKRDSVPFKAVVIK
jgi:hypothetical protein